MDVDKEGRHFSREPWWVIPLGGFAAALLPLLKYGRLQQALPGTDLGSAMMTAGCLGAVASAILVARSHVRDPFCSNVVLWLGILVVAVGACILLSLMPG